MSGQWRSSGRRGRLPANWPAIRAYVLLRDGYRCQLRYPCCTHVANQADHITPGDDHSTANLQAACPPCHAKKSATEGAAASVASRASGRLQSEPHPGLS